MLLKAVVTEKYIKINVLNVYVIKNVDISYIVKFHLTSRGYFYNSLSERVHTCYFIIVISCRAKIITTYHDVLTC
jgi:hypothetical protein